MTSAQSADLTSRPEAPTRSRCPRSPMLRSRSSNQGLRPAALLLLGLVLALAGSAWGAPIQVETTAASSTAECTLAEAMAIANAGDPTDPAVDDCVWNGVGDPEIHLEEATYETAGVLPFVIDSGVTMTIKGGGGNTAATIRRDPADPLRNFFKVKGTLMLTNVTLTGGEAGAGGAINLFEGGALTLSVCRFLGNSATDKGGAIHSRGALVVSNCTFDGNSAGYRGGAIYGGSVGTITISNSAFVDNSSEGDGGAVAIFSKPGGIDPDLEIESSTFSSNDADWGGALAVVRGEASVDMSTFKDNTSMTFGSAIAVAASRATVTLKRSAFAGCDSCSPAVADLCDGPVTSGGNNAAEDDSCGLSGTGDQQTVALNLSELVDNHGGLTPVHVPLCLWTEEGTCDSPLIEQYDCEAGSRDQRDQFGRDEEKAGEYCDVGAYESICSDVHTLSDTLQQVELHGYQVGGATQLLDNGGCYSHTITFEGTEDCRLEWLVDTQLVVSDVIHIEFDEASCLYPSGEPVNCFTRPEDCAAHCALPDPAGWTEYTASGGRFGFDIPSCVVEPFRYVVEYHHFSTPNNKLHWDPRNPIDM